LFSSISLPILVLPFIFYLGSYLVTCDFNKNITLIDFFSGEVIFHLSGHHSELITGLKFSLDGSSLMSIGGDGCIMVWKTSYGLVRSMKDRLIELFTKAQKRNSKVMIKQGALSSASFSSSASAASHQSHLLSSPPSHKSAASSSSAGSGAFPPPPPSPSASERSVQSSLSNLKMKLSSKQHQQQQQSHHNLNDSSSIPPPPPPPPPSGFDQSNLSALSSSTASTSTTNSKKNRWQENLQKDNKGGYELFGKKVHASTEETDGKHRNKFTLELTGSVLPGEKTIKPVNKENQTESEEEAEKMEEEPTERNSSVGVDDDDQGINSSSSAAAMLNESSSSIKAQHHEDKDDVNLPGVSSDEDEDVEKLFKSLDEYESDFDVGSPSTSPSKVNKQLKLGEDGLLIEHSLTLSKSPSTLGISSGISSFHEEEKDLNTAQSNIDHLEKSANDLESWLEDMVSSFRWFIISSFNSFC
jgi:hypothetical protein